MKIGFATGDIGGVRALMPVMELAVKKGIDVYVLCNGSIIKETTHLKIAWNWVDVNSNLSNLTLDRFAFSSSVSDFIPLEWAQNLQNKKIPVLHLLDHWGNYKKRVTTKNNSILHPNIYAVMDEISANEVIAAGFNPSTVKITGSPALSKISKRSEFDCRDHVVFISEPVFSDYYKSHKNVDFRGYSESEVLDLLLKTHAEISPNLRLWILPHPRESTKGINSLLQKYNINKNEINISIVKNIERTRILNSAKGIVGMRSILLYECWLSGFPILSIQPNLEKSMHNFLLNKPGVEYCLDTKKFKRIFSNWIKFDYNPVKHYKMAEIELEKHRTATKKVLNEIINMK